MGRHSSCLCVALLPVCVPRVPNGGNRLEAGGGGAAGAVPAVAGAHSPSCTSVASGGSETSHPSLLGCCF